MSTKEIGRSVFAGRAARIDQTVIKAIIDHHGQVVKFMTKGTTPCTCTTSDIGDFYGNAGDSDCSICSGSGFTAETVRYIKAFFTPYSYFSGSDNQKLYHKAGVHERSNIKMYVSGDTLTDMDVHNGDWVMWRGVEYFVVSIFPYTGTDSYYDGMELLRKTVFAEISLSIHVKQKSEITGSIGRGEIQ